MNHRKSTLHPLLSTLRAHPRRTWSRGLAFAAALGVTTVGTAASAADWGSVQADMCRGENSAGQGVRQHSAILWNIPWGYSWEQACAETPAVVEGQYFATPTRCVNDGLHMWGEFDVVDPSCQVSREMVEQDISFAMQVDSMTCDWSQAPADGCSNPFSDPVSKIYRDIFNPACVVHDYCYTSPWGATYGRYECDLMFYTHMNWLCDPQDLACTAAADAFYAAVTAFGHDAYMSSQALVNNGTVTCSVE